MDTRESVGRLWLQAMRAGDWEAAWQQTDRLEIPRRQAQGRPGFAWEPHLLVWDGTPFAGRRVLVRCSHGLGDTLQFLRFVPAIAAQAGELHFLVQPHLLGLLRGLPGLGEVADAWSGLPPPPHEVEVEVMELAYALRAAPATVPPPYPHLAQRACATSPVRAARDHRLQVGLLWSASDWDGSRSVPTPLLRPLLAVDGVRFHGLQQGPAAQDAVMAEGDVVPLWRQTADIVDAAAAMLSLDLVISIDGMPAHLAATLGRPTWVLLKHQADWRWGSGRTTPWYPSMRLFRQPAEGDWAGVIVQVTDALRNEVSRGRSAAAAAASPRLPRPR